MAHHLKISLLLLFISIHVANSANCFCSDSSLCNPVTASPRKEVYAFMFPGDMWQHYDWNLLTTVAIFTDTFDPQVICTAHQHNTRAVFGAVFPVQNLTNAEQRKLWIDQQIQRVKDNFADGINVDVESPINETSPEHKFLTILLKETVDAFHKAMPHSQVTFDVAWSPACIDLRCYDYAGLAKVTDFLIVMDYDMRSQIRGPCIAGANSNIVLLMQGMNAFLKLGIDSQKLVMGLPWYGYDYACINPQNDTICPIKEVPFRGVQCSDAAGKQLGYGTVRQILATQSTTGRRWDSESMTPWFDYKDLSTGQHHQIWYEDPVSIEAKVKQVKPLNLRGIGMWAADFLDYVGQPEESQEMWNAFGKFLN